MNLLVGRGTWYKKVAKTLGTNWTTSCTADSLQDCKVVVNFGLVGDKWENFKFGTESFLKPSCKKINWNLEPNKFKAAFICGKNDIQSPKIYPYNSSPVNFFDDEHYGEWIVKPKYSIGGKGIVEWEGQNLTKGQYFQRRIKNRAYELRVHAFKWVSPDKWLVFKRTHPAGEAQLTWNFKQGGSFSTIENGNVGIFKRAKEASLKVLECLNQDFGAVDFICSKDDDPLIPWFIEINSSPGMKIPGVKQAYVSAFNSL